MPLARAFLHDAPHVGQKTHVQHAVGFVQHEELDVVEPAEALLHQVQQPARRGDKDVNPSVQGLALSAVTDSAKHHRHLQIGEAGEITEGGLDLGGQFARRFEHQNARVRLGAAESRQDGQPEGGGLARAGLRAADNVLPRQDQRDSAQLDRCWLDIPHRLHPFEHRAGKT